MTELIFVTGNASKFREAAAILEPFGIRLVQRDLLRVEPKLDDPRAVVRWKARRAFQRLRQPLIVDDTALTLAGYPNFPGAYTAEVAHTLGAAGLGRLLDPDHRAVFTAFVCCHDGRPHLFTGRWRGRMIPGRGFTDSAWPYNALFVPDGFDRPLSDIAWDVRLQHSHRRRALDKLARFLAGRAQRREDAHENR
jgi:non-canonical purine NTP pyrophosphatase (RdgB/HAM1 family)